MTPTRRRLRNSRFADSTIKVVLPAPSIPETMTTCGRALSVIGVCPSKRDDEIEPGPEHQLLSQGDSRGGAAQGGLNFRTLTIHTYAGRSRRAPACCRDRAARQCAVNDAN